MAAKYEDSFWKTIWEFLPGILKFFSIVSIVGLLLNFFSLAVTKTAVVIDGGTYDVSIQRNYNYAEGKSDASVKLLYFEDFECPHCRDNASIMTQVKTTYDDRVQFVYKNFPLESIHIYAKLLAQAAQAANKQGKFMPFADKVFDLQDGNKYSNADLDGVAASAGLDVTQFDTDRNSDLMATQVSNDLQDLQDVELPANSDGVSKPSGSMTSSDNQSLGTPMSILYKDGKVVDWWTGGITIDQLNSKIDNALN
jgi:hypothetical protein